MVFLLLLLLDNHIVTATVVLTSSTLIEYYSPRPQLLLKHVLRSMHYFNLFDSIRYVAAFCEVTTAFVENFAAFVATFSAWCTYIGILFYPHHVQILQWRRATTLASPLRYRNYFFFLLKMHQLLRYKSMLYFIICVQLTFLGSTGKCDVRACDIRFPLYFVVRIFHRSVDFIPFALLVYVVSPAFKRWLISICLI